MAERNISESGPEKDDAGVATIFACLCVGLFLLVTGIGLRLGGALLAREQAETAADLGALAGAARMLTGSDGACARAGVVVQANGGTVVSCRAEGLDLMLEVQTPAWGGAAQAHARGRPGLSGLTQRMRPTAPPGSDLKTTWTASIWS